MKTFEHEGVPSSPLSDSRRNRGCVVRITGRPAPVEYQARSALGTAAICCAPAETLAKTRTVAAQSIVHGVILPETCSACGANA